MNARTWVLIAVVIIVAAAVVIFALFGHQAVAPTGPAGSGTPAATSSATLGGQIYQNVAPQAAVPQSLPQVNPFSQ